MFTRRTSEKLESEDSQMQDILSRLSVLEQRERKYADDILTLTRENKDLTKKADEMKGKVDGMERLIRSLQKGNNFLKKLKSQFVRLDEAVKDLRKEVKSEAKSQKSVQEQIAELDRIRMALNRALVQNHQKTKSDGPPVSKDSRTEEENTEKNGQLLTRIRTMDRRLGGLDAIEERLEIIDKWKETAEETDDQWKKRKESEDSRKFKLCDENFKTLNSKIDDFKDLENSMKALASIVKSNSGQGSNLGAEGNSSEDQDKFSRSIFCAQLQTHQPLAHLEVTKIIKCPTILKSSDGPFTSGSGMLRPKEDGIYNLGWKIHQAGDGKIRFLLAVDGIDGRIYLGYTEEPGDVCSGCLFVPLKKEQRVWLEAKRVRGPDPRVLSCNFMGCLLKTCNLESLAVLAKLQEGLFRPIQTDCQHL